MRSSPPIDFHAVGSAIGDALHEGFQRGAAQQLEQESYEAARVQQDKLEQRRVDALERLGFQLQELNQTLQAIRMDGLRLQCNHR